MHPSPLSRSIARSAPLPAVGGAAACANSDVRPQPPARPLRWQPLFRRGLAALAIALCWGAATTALAQNQGPVMSSQPGPTSAGVAASGALTSVAAGRRLQGQHDRELEAIRRALLESTLQGTTRVMSSAWIDEQGELRELSHFNSESRVHGVRVLGYVDDEGDQAPVVSAEVLPWGWPRQDGPSCSPPQRNWRLPLQVHSQLEAGLSGPQQWIAQTLLQGASERWMQALAGSTRWLAQPAQPRTASAYERALTGNGQPHEGWQLQLRLGPAPAQAWQALNPIERHQRRDHWALRLSLHMQQSPAAAGDAPGVGTLQMSQDLWVDPQALSGASAQAFALALQQSLQIRLAHWAQRLQAHFDCEPMRFAVHHDGSRRLLLQAGQGSGLRPGDRVLVLDPARVPGQILEPAALGHLALAEVVRVNRHQTELQQLAGPDLPAASTWVALPL